MAIAVRGFGFCGLPAQHFFGGVSERRPWIKKREAAGPLLPGFLIDFPAASPVAPTAQQLGATRIPRPRRLAPAGSGEIFASAAAKSRSRNSSIRLWSAATFSDWRFWGDRLLNPQTQLALGGVKTFV
jgi:hypothetical protein